VNCPTTRGNTPDADPRTGRGESVPRGTQYHTGVPFAALPHDIAADPRLSPTDLRVLAALFYFARADASCWPTDEAIAARVHRHPGTVRRALRRLEGLGYLRREVTRENHTGRLIHLTCKEPDWPRPVPVPTPERRRTGGSSAGARRRRRDHRKNAGPRTGWALGTITTRDPSDPGRPERAARPDPDAPPCSVGSRSPARVRARPAPGLPLRAPRVPAG
jgi:hypothetical protein